MGQIIDDDEVFESGVGLLLFGGSLVAVNKLFEFGRRRRFLYLGFLSFSRLLLHSDLRTSGEKTGSVARSASVSTNFTRSRNITTHP